jgi:hypothetical protein
VRAPPWRGCGLDGDHHLAVHRYDADDPHPVGSVDRHDSHDHHAVDHHPNHHDPEVEEAAAT